MNTKRWAVFLLCLLSFDYVRAIVDQPLPPIIDNSVDKLPTFNSSRTKRQLIQPVQEVVQPVQEVARQCNVDCGRVTVLVDETLERCRGQLKDSYELRDETVEDLQLVGGTAEGFQNFQRLGDLQCSCTEKVLVFFCEINYVNIVVSYTVTLLEGVLGGLLGNLGRSLSRLLGGVVNLLVRVLVLEIRVTLKVTQRLEAGSNCVLVGYRVRRITKLSLLDAVDLTSLAQSLQGVLSPVLDLVLQLVMSQQVRDVMIQEFGQLSIPVDVVTWS